MVASLLACALVGFALVAFGSRLGRKAFLVAAVPLAGVLAWATSRVGDVADGRVASEHLAWVPRLGLSVDLRLDGLAVTMSLIVTGVGVVVLAYAASYFAPDARDLGRLAGLVVLFAGAMLCIVQADHVILLYAGWELTSITSFLLIGNRHTESRARAAALHALLVTSAGGLALLGGLVVLSQEAGSYRISEILDHPPASGTAVTAAMALILVGAFTKSAQYPFHAWLPGAMAASTPVSAYLHSATMVTAGVFLVARLAPVFAPTHLWRPLVVAAGCASLVFGGLRALRQHDLKLLLAFGTVSQLGLLLILFGLGTEETTTAGWELLVAHAAFKATLFMVVGIIDHQAGTRDIRVLPPLTHGWRGVQVVAALATASMIGLPLTAGFVAKELAFAGLEDVSVQGGVVLLGAVVVGSMLTTAYGIRFFWGAFVAPRRPSMAGHEGAGAAAVAPVAPPTPAFLAPAAFLALVGLVLGIFPNLVAGLATASLADYGEAAQVDLSPWHVGVPLALSAVVLVGGALLAFGDRWVQAVLRRGSGVPSGAEVYLATLRGLGLVAARFTAFVQSGSLPVYAGVIVGTAALLPAVALFVGNAWAGWPAFGSFHQAPVLMALLVAALGAAIVRQRFAAAVFLSVAGYAMAGLFVLLGAPDLALTQATVETLTTVVFVLVLRRLPERFEPQSSPRRRLVRVVIAGAVAASVFLFALVAAGHRITSPVSDEMVARSVPDGNGRNVVNVILVDFRAFDTLGEISVLAVAAIGAAALARVGRRGPGRPAAPAPRLEQFRRLVFVDVSVRIVFHAVLLMSLWLLFAGHNQPGGGFVGGLVAGSALTLRYIAGGADEVRRRSRFRPWTVLGAGMLLATVTAIVPLLFGGSVLEVGLATLQLPVIGAVKVSSALVFDTGVYLAVVGMVLMALEAFGEDEDDAVVEAELEVVT